MPVEEAGGERMLSILQGTFQSAQTDMETDPVTIGVLSKQLCCSVVTVKGQMHLCRHFRECPECYLVSEAKVDLSQFTTSAMFTLDTFFVLIPFF